MHKQASERVYAVQALTFDESTHERTRERVALGEGRAWQKKKGKKENSEAKRN